MSQTKHSSLDRSKSKRVPSTTKAPLQVQTALLDLHEKFVVVPIDKQLIVPALISEFDELVNHYEVRSKYAHEIGQELATSFDEHVCIEGLLGARSANELAELPGGGQYVDDLLKNDGGVSGSADDAGVALALVTGVFAAAEAMDYKNVPESGRYIALRPKEYNILIKEAQTNGMSAINKDIDGNGSISKGTIFELAGITILKYPRLPSTNILQGTSDSKNFYHYGDFSKTVGFVWQEDAIGTAKLQGLKMDVKDLTVTHLAHAMLSRYLMGHKVLRPESCFELTLDTLTVA